MRTAVGGGSRDPREGQPSPSALGRISVRVRGTIRGIRAQGKVGAQGRCGVHSVGEGPDIGALDAHLVEVARRKDSLDVGEARDLVVDGQDISLCAKFGSVLSIHLMQERQNA